MPILSDEFPITQERPAAERQGGALPSGARPVDERASAKTDGGAPLGIYRQRETQSDVSPVVPAKIERKKDVKNYTDDERQRWKEEKQRENSRKAAIARRWIAEQENGGRLPSICHCGRAVKGQSAAVYLTDGAEIYNEHMHCRSWACPVCAHKRAWGRALELQSALIAAARRGYRQLFITFTIPHTKRQKTKTVLRHLNAAYHRFRNDRSVKRLLSEFGFVGQVKALDFTFTDNGTHAHFHTVYIFSTASPLESVAAECCGVMLEAWDAAVRAEVGRGINRRRGFDVEMVEIPEGDDEQAEAIALYAAKVISIYAAGQDKDKGSLTPFDLLDEEREEEYKPIFQDFYKGSKGVRRLVFSRGLKSALGVSPAEYEKPKQAAVMRISPMHTDFLRDEGNRQQLRQMLTSARASEAVEWLRQSVSAPLVANARLVAALDAIAEADRAASVAAVVLDEVERREEFAALLAEQPPEKPPPWFV